MNKVIFIFLLSICTKTVIAQFLPNYFPVMESNRPKGNRYLHYRLYSSSNSTNPNTSAEFESTFATAANYKTSGYVTLATNAGNLNTSNNASNNILNYLNFTQLGSAIGNNTPYVGFDGQGYTLVISGYFVPKQSGVYTFSIEGDDAVELFINDQNVVNHYGAHGSSSIGTHTGTINLVSGKKYLFRVRMQQGYGGDVLQLFWKKPSESGGSIWYQDIEELTSEEVLPNGLVLSLDPGNWFSYPKYGSTTYDLKGNANGGMYGNLVANFSSSNGGLFYSDGDQDYIDFGKTPANFPTGDISIFVWLKASTLRSNWNIFLTKWFADLNNGGGTDFHYDLFNNGASIRQHLFTTSKSDMFGSAFLTTNTWYQVGFTISSGNMQMYLNASLDGPVRSNAARTNNTSSSLWIGDARTGGALDFNGYIGSINIYNRALSADEVFQNFNATKHKYGL